MTILCSLCLKKFHTHHGLAQHAKDFHKKRAAEVTAMAPKRREEQEDGESEADRQIEREIEAAGRRYLSLTDAQVHGMDSTMQPISPTTKKP